MKKLVWITITTLMLWSCKDKNATQHTAHEKVAQNMDLRPTVMLDQHQQMVANVTIDTVREGIIDEMVTLLGTTAVNENSSSLISARVKGRVEVLYAKTPGQTIQKGMPLYRIYSEELLADEEEYLTALRFSQKAVLQQELTQKLLKASRKKLLLWGLKENQIRELERSGVSNPLMTFYSDYNGILSQLLVNEGQYVDIGTPMFGVTNLSQLWIEGQLYGREVANLNLSDKVEVEFPFLPNQFFKATIVYESPALDPESKISLVRFVLNNPKMQLKPGEMAYIHLSKASKQAVVVPRSAIVYETIPAVWIKIGEGEFEKRMVRLGIQNKKQVEILEGLEPGEVVAATGSYLINSEYILKKGAGSMEGMKM